MESLRWILLAVGIFFVLVVYILGRSRRRRNHSIVDELDADLPEFSAKTLDDVDEGVGQVKIISGAGLAADNAGELDTSAAADQSEEPHGEPAEAVSVEKTTGSAATRLPSDIIVLYLLPKANQKLTGSQINSAVQAMGLTFGEMNIFHYKSANRNVFSIANMLEPGSFDVKTIHDLKTSGLSIFMQITGDDPLDDLTEMLQRSYQLAGLLGARLCNHRRQPLTQQDAENYREQVSDFINEKSAELSSET
ncbi:MAG: cell division protein ZipA C-terminal FtsZ-binding domain-containing protein [Gammaproteobacteria bacterium]|jgi:cell division protein ZipA|nr:cell division protein ZipA C-terminal FtsZ-binding domain-containing protein [Gammaproteobacteria bacterium]